MMQMYEIMRNIKCNTCGGDVQLSEDGAFAICEYCGNRMMIEGRIPDFKNVRPAAGGIPKAAVSGSNKKKLPNRLHAVGEMISLGRFVQDADSPEPIIWRVLAANERVELLISERALDVHAYHNARSLVGWSDCALRKWLNGAFLEQAFDDSERASLHRAVLPALEYKGAAKGAPQTDLVFLLSASEVRKYLSGTRWLKAGVTAHVRNQGAFVDRDIGTCRWWLRSPVGLAMTAGFVETDGSIDEQGTNQMRVTICVRPALFRRTDI